MLKRLPFAAVLTLLLSGPAQAHTPAPLRAFAPTAPAGQTNFDVANRAAISNVIQAYALAYDTSDADAWFKLFTADAVIVADIQGTAPVIQSGDAFRKSALARLANFKASGNQRRHLMSNITFLDQTKSTAHVSVVGLLTDVSAGTFTAVTNLNYEGWFTKAGGVWKISRWHDFPDSSVEVAPPW